MAVHNAQFKSKLDLPIAPDKQLSFHAVLRDASLNSAILPDDPVLTERWFCIYKYFQIVFLAVFCGRRLLECFLPAGSIVYLYIGDFKVWWGEPYIANQVVWGMAAIIVPCYQFINLYTICKKDRVWCAPFRFAQGLQTARKIKLEEEQQMVKLLSKMKFGFHQCFVMHYSVLVSYTIAVFVSYYLLVYQSDLHRFTLGVFWTIVEAYWARKISLNMGLYPVCLETITFYLNLRYTKAEEKLRRVLTKDFTSRNLYANLYQMSESMRELDAINGDLQHCNHYWRKYMLCVFVSYIPQILFEVFSCIYVPMQSSVFIFGLTLTLNMLFLVTQVCVFSATIIHKAYSMSRPLNLVYTRLSQFVEQSPISKSERHIVALWYQLKLSTFLEQYHHKKMGFYLLDFQLMDWNFYYSTITNCVIYFLLIVGVFQGVVQSDLYY